MKKHVDDEKMKDIILQSQKNEITEYYVYKPLAELTNEKMVLSSERSQRMNFGITSFGRRSLVRM